MGSGVVGEMFGFWFFGGYRGRRAEADRLGLVTGPLIWFLYQFFGLFQNHFNRF